jgi:hypothetical protein
MSGTQVVVGVACVMAFFSMALESSPRPLYRSRDAGTDSIGRRPAFGREGILKTIKRCMYWIGIVALWVCVAVLGTLAAGTIDWLANLIDRARYAH